MKLIRFGDPGYERAGVLDADGRRLDVTDFGEDWNEQFFGADGPSRLDAWVRANRGHCPVVGDAVRLGPCVARPSKLVCIGLNYSDHARETGATPPAEPVLFFKSTTSICGPFDDIILPPDSTKTDWEVELAVVIGRRASRVSEAGAMQHVAGYALHNDVSERHWQMERGGQWVKGKSFDTFAPLGPFLATRDEIADPQALDLWLTVNGAPMQQGTTANMLFGVSALVSYVSQCMTLVPGDVISTGTPAGVGLGMQPPRYLAAGDVVELGAAGLGTSRQRVATE
jgi:2,4-didehydro-3-deoxy-L-rhamnonate hydrolase